MNLLITIVLCTSVLIHVVFGAKQGTSPNVSGEDERIHETPFTNLKSRSKKRGSRRQSQKKSDTPYVVRAVTYKGKRVYKCNGQFFRTKKGAKECLWKLKKEPKLPLPRRPAFPPYKLPPICKPPIPPKPLQIPPPIPRQQANRRQISTRRPLWPGSHNNLQNHFQRLHIK